MKNKTNKLSKIVVAILLSALLCFAVPANAQVQSNSATVSLNFTSAATISISVTPASVSFGPSGTASSPITVITSWNLSNAQRGVIGYAYFSTSTALSGPANIPASGISATVDGQSMTFTFSDPTGGSNGLQYTGIHNINFPASPFTGTQTDTVLLSIPNAGNYAPGSYTGVLNFLAVSA